MSEFDLTEDIAPDEEPDAEEFDGTEPGADSEDTGTHYNEFGEPEATPHDVAPDDEPDDEGEG